MISSTQLTDMDEKRMGKSGPGVQHTCRPRKAGPMKLPELSGQKSLQPERQVFFPQQYQLV